MSPSNPGLVEALNRLSDAPLGNKAITILVVIVLLSCLLYYQLVPNSWKVSLLSYILALTGS